jgi:hypothetical protein
LTSGVQNPVLALGEESVKYHNNYGNPPSNNQIKIVPQTTDSGINIMPGEVDTASYPRDQEIVNPDADFFPGYRTLSVNGGFLLPDAILKLPGYRIGNYSDAVSDDLDKYSYDIPRVKIARWSIMAMASPTFFMSPASGSDDPKQTVLRQSRISSDGACI